jgi:hypothetical protein
MYRYPALVLVLLFFCSITASAQRKYAGYVMTDSALLQGQVRNLGKGRIEYRRAPGTTPLKYPDIYIKEYSDNGKDVYEALAIDGQRSFYERMVNGKTKLYYRRGAYVLKTDETMQVFNRSNFRSVISSGLPCDGSDKSFVTLSYSKAAIKQLVIRSNENRCNTDVLPYRKIGIYAGYNFLAYELYNERYSIDGTSRAPSIGLFFDQPIHRVPSIYFSADVNWLSTKPILYTGSGGNSHYAALDINQVTAQADLKFILGQRKLRPYFKVGAFMSFVNVRAPDGVLGTAQAGNVVDISQDEFHKSSGSLPGFHAGAGLELRLTKRKNLHLELKYQKSASTSVAPFNLKYSNVAISLGFNI